jgi:Domain of unknown function (DUF4232)
MSGVVFRRVLMVGVALLAMSTAACARQAEPIPWNNEPAPRPEPQVTTKPVPRPAQPPCRADDLESLWPDSGYTFSDGVSESDATGLAVLVRNVGPAACSLSGHPKVQGTDNDGKPVGPPAEPGIYLRKVDPGHHPAVIEPGEPAKILLSMTSDGCPGPQRDVRGADVMLDNGFSFSIKNAWLRGACQLRVSAWGEVEQRVRRFWALEAKLLAPPVVKAGAELVYTIELINVTAAQVPLEPCPIFTQLLSLDEQIEPEDIDKLYRQTYRLNCAVRSVAPRGAIRYQMKMLIPQSFPIGKTYVYWFIEDGEYPSAMTAVTITR